MPDLVAQNCQLTLSAITLKTPFPRSMPDLVAQNCQLTLSAITLKTPFPRSMHYERAPRFPRSKLEGAASAALRCAGLRSASAALGSKWSGVSGAKGLQRSIGKSAGEWHFTLGGKEALTRMRLEG